VATESSPSDAPKLVALSYGAPVPIVPAARRRAWMDAPKDRWPNRCLPLLVANEAGWTLQVTDSFTATWDGGENRSAVTIEFESGATPNPAPVSSHFGYGVITFSVPYVFRTPPGWNLLARGPANWPKDGICALEGLVETDWAHANFTMNWKLTRPGYPVAFDEGEPFCMIVPQRRGDLEAFAPEMRPIDTDSVTKAEFETFGHNREQLQIRKFLGEYSAEYAEDKETWEKHYYRGLTPSGSPAAEHQTKLHLAPFAEHGNG
jgi:hypothetical protein